MVLLPVANASTFCCFSTAYYNYISSFKAHQYSHLHMFGCITFDVYSLGLCVNTKESSKALYATRCNNDTEVSLTLFTRVLNSIRRESFRKSSFGLHIIVYSLPSLA